MRSYEAKPAGREPCRQHESYAQVVIQAAGYLAAATFEQTLTQYCNNLEAKLDTAPVGAAAASGRPLLLDNNAIITLDLLPPTGHSSSSSSSSGGGTAAAAATALTQGGAASTLFGLLDRAVSAAGRRKLRQWICR